MGYWSDDKTYEEDPVTGLSKEQLEMLKPGSTKRPEIPEGMFAPMRSAQDAIELAYGLLWCMSIDRETPNGLLASEARQALLLHLDRDGQARGISAARATLANQRTHHDLPFHQETMDGLSALTIRKELP